MSSSSSSSSSEMSPNQKSYLKLAQICNAFQDDYPIERIFKRLLKKPGDINYKIPSSNTLKSTQPDLIGCTALHLAAFKSHLNAFNLLLNQGADFTIQNQQGKTALHCALDQESDEISQEFIASVLTAHIVTGDSTNPCDNDGLSHFHVACWKNNVRAVKFFLEMGIPVDDAVSMDSTNFAGYTPLHFAIKGYAVETVFLLLKHHADMQLKDANGMTALHLLLQDKIRMFNSLSYLDRMRREKDLQAIDEILDLLSANHTVDSIGLTKFHIACTMQDSSVAEYILYRTRDINHKVNFNSKLFAGYTGLHFAVQCNIATAKLLIDKGVNSCAKDAHGKTPLDICLENRKWQELQSLLKCELEWKNLSFDNGKAKLLDFIAALQDSVIPSVLYNYLRDVVRDVNTSIPHSSPLWPGFTPLHFAVLASEETSAAIIRLCLVQGADATVQDKRGWSPLHLAFRRNKVQAIKWLLLHHHELANTSDEDGLSHLHVACASGHLEFVDRLQYSFDLNVVYKGEKSIGLVEPGSTLLHVAVASGSDKIVEILLNHHVNIEAQDAKGETPLHRFLGLNVNVKETGRVLLASEMLKDRMLEKVGLSRIHLAVYCEVWDEIDKSEENIDVTINCDDSSSFWYNYNSCTALYLGIKENSSERFLKKLLERGADPLAARLDGMTPVYEVLSSDCDKFAIDLLIDALKSSEELQKRLEITSGITMLHVACYLVDVELVKFTLMEQQIDANSQVNMNCPIWRGDTPMHVLLKIVKHISRCGISEDFQDVLEMLLSTGADVTITNHDGDSPVHVVFDNFSIQLAYKFIDILISQQRDFNLNPVNGDGLSHFHAACMVNNYEAADKFLKHQAKLNEPLDMFADKFAGESPLHLAVDFQSRKMFGAERQLQTINLLLARGANVCAEDNFGFTPLHKAVCRSPCMDIIDKLVTFGAIINAENIFGETPLEITLKSEQIPVTIMRFFANLGCRLNSSNPISEVGYMSLVISNYHHRNANQERAHEVMLEADDMAAVDEMGRIAIHNIVTTPDTAPGMVDYTEFMEMFFETDYDIDLQDMRGKTALHLAAKFGNVLAVEALLNLGVNVNLVDANERTALFYAIKFLDRCKRCCVKQCHRRTIHYLARHIRKLQALKLDVDNLNAYLMRVEVPKISDARLLDPRFVGQIEIAKRLIVDEDSQLYLYDFLSETRALLDYPFMSEEKRTVIDEFFQTVEHNLNLDTMRDICKLQHRKAIKRVKMIDVACQLMYRSFGFSVPVLCQKLIFQSLKNADIHNFIVASMNV